MTNRFKISRAFEPFLSHSQPNSKKDAIVIYRGLVEPGSMPQPGTAAYFDTLKKQEQSNLSIGNKIIKDYQTKTSQSFYAEPVGQGSLPIAQIEVSRQSLPILAEHPDVMAILPNQKIHLIQPKEIDYSGLQKQEEQDKITWGLKRLEIPKVWETTQGQNVTVAVLDSGVHGDHPALKGRVKDFIVIDPLGRRITATPSFDSGQHGTHVCGTIAGGKTEEGLSIGVAPQADLIVAGVLVGDATLLTLMEGISWAVEKGAKIINMSLGFSYYEPLFPQVFDILVNQYGILPIVAIGNENHGNTSSPGNAYNSFSVGAVELTEGDNLGITFFSSGASLVFPSDSPNAWVTKPDVSAPGAQIYSCIPPVKMDNGVFQYTYMDGTSMATPHIAGIVALLMSAYPQAPLSKIIDVLKKTAYHPGGEEQRPDNRWGWGMVRPLEALNALK
jgi:subtilisin family serine protease